MCLLFLASVKLDVAESQREPQAAEHDSWSSDLLIRFCAFTGSMPGALASSKVALLIKVQAGRLGFVPVGSLLSATGRQP